MAFCIIASLEIKRKEGNKIGVEHEKEKEEKIQPLIK